MFSTHAPKTLDNYRVLDAQHTMPKKWQPQQPSALRRGPKEDQVADCHLHARLESADLLAKREPPLISMVLNQHDVIRPNLTLEKAQIHRCPF